MTEADQFLSAIVADPDADLPRLVFADWLEEHGDPDRAEFIRLQCAAGPDRGLQPSSANKELWQIPGIPGHQRFRRGFVEYLYIGAVDFLEHAEHVGRSAPVIDLRLSTALDHLTPLTRVPWLPRLRGLEFQNDYFAGRLREFFGPVRFPHLRSLSLRNMRIWAENVATLTRLAANWPRLERLNLSGNYVGDDGLTHLAGAAALAGLHDLAINGDGIDYEYTVHAAGAAAFAGSPHLTGLRTLRLAGQRIGDAGFRSLVESPNVRHLERLDVSQNEIGRIGPEWAAALAASPHLTSLRELNLGRNTIDHLAAAALVEWPQLAAGCVVDLSGSDISHLAYHVINDSPSSGQFRFRDEDVP